MSISATANLIVTLDTLHHEASNNPVEYCVSVAISSLCI